MEIMLERNMTHMYSPMSMICPYSTPAFWMDSHSYLGQKPKYNQRLALLYASEVHYERREDTSPDS